MFDKRMLIMFIVVVVFSLIATYMLFTTARKTKSNMDTGRFATKREVSKEYGTYLPRKRKIIISSILAIILTVALTINRSYPSIEVYLMFTGLLNSLFGGLIYAAISIYSEKYDSVMKWFVAKRNFYHLGKYKGIAVSLPREKRFLHTLIVGPTGIGKTSSLIIPQLLYDAQGSISAVVIDAKSPELYNKVGGAWIENGKKVILFDPWHSDCWGFNPLLKATRDDILQMVKAFLGEQRKIGKRDEFFEGRADDFLEALFMIIQNDFKEEQCNLSMAYEIIASYDILEQFIRSCRNAEVIEKFSDYTKRTNESKMDILSSVRKKLSIFKDPHVGAAFSRSDFSLDILFRESEPALLIIGVPSDKKEVGMQIASLLTRLIMRRVLEETRIQRQMQSRGEVYFKANDVALYLDEFENLNILDMPEYISIARDTNVQCILSSTNIDFFETYGDRMGSILTNLRTQIFLSGNNLRTSKYVSEMLGKQKTRTERYYSNPIIPWLQKKQISFETDVVMSDDDIRNMKTDQAICFTPDTRPFVLNLERYYETRRIKRLISPLPADIKPLKGKWGINIEPLTPPQIPKWDREKTSVDLKKVKKSQKTEYEKWVDEQKRKKKEKAESEEEKENTDKDTYEQLKEKHSKDIGYYEQKEEPQEKVIQDPFETDQL